ncbi:hypothetical protein CYMTET_6151 [Cymbomonas tetramitiformis]|uniref:Peroxidase n=1 Tax=Cymbomonas tetramitiformis TaxID=36881 RepID=A0AAE0GY43_9CHLO|nr:hypothetical protein CYMTET_6151 [Cymbomonas tetramitiformis]
MPVSAEVTITEILNNDMLSIVENNVISSASSGRQYTRLQSSVVMILPVAIALNANVTISIPFMITPEPNGTVRVLQAAMNVSRDMIWTELEAPLILKSAADSRLGLATECCSENCVTRNADPPFEKTCGAVMDTSGLQCQASQEVSSGVEVGRSKLKEGQEDGQPNSTKALSDLSMCPLLAKCAKPQVQCDEDPDGFSSYYRTPEGTCNNLKKPRQGAAGQPQVRLLDADYDVTNKHSCPSGFKENSRPNARKISLDLMRAEANYSAMMMKDPPSCFSNSGVQTSCNDFGPSNDDPTAMCSCNTHMLMQWGQFLDHDITFTPQIITGADVCANCSMDNTDTCYPIPILDGDPDFEVGSCIKFTRSDADCGSGLGFTGATCDTKDSAGVRTSSWREQLNGITSYIDASQVYGSDQSHADAIREPTIGSRGGSRRGRLRVCDENCLRKVFARRGIPTELANGLGDFPPFDLNALAGEGGGEGGEDSGSEDSVQAAEQAACSGSMTTEDGVKTCDLPGAQATTTAAAGTCNATCQGLSKASGHCGGLLPCFSVGDVRGNENIGLLSMQTVFMREHNRLAGILSQMNPTWSDEDVYQEARKIVGAEMQIVTYKEYHPANMGSNAFEFGSIGGRNGDTPRDHLQCHSKNAGDSNDRDGIFRTPSGRLAESCDWYDDTMPADTLNEFSTAGFRLGHTQVADAFERYDDQWRSHPNGHVLLRHAFFNSSKVLLEGGVEPIIRGLTNQVCHGHDLKLVYDLGRDLFGPPGPKGLDLVALNIQRGRDHGLPTFNAFRERYFGKGRGSIRNFSIKHHEDKGFFDKFLDPNNGFERDILMALSKAYNGRFDQLDAWVGFLAERRLFGWEWGVTLSRLLAEQFKRYRNGDRFFWTNRGVFTLPQRRALSQVSLAGIICANSNINELQPNVFKLDIAAGNSRKECRRLIEDDGAALINTAQSLHAWRGSARKSEGTLRESAERASGSVPPRKRAQRNVLQQQDDANSPRGEAAVGGSLNEEESFVNNTDTSSDDSSSQAEIDGQELVDRLPSTTACPACQAMLGACGIEDVPPLATKFVQFEMGIVGGAGIDLATSLPEPEDDSVISTTISFRKLMQSTTTNIDISDANGDLSQPVNFQYTYRRRIAHIAGVNESDVILRHAPKIGLLTASFVFGRPLQLQNHSSADSATNMSNISDVNATSGDDQIGIGHNAQEPQEEAIDGAVGNDIASTSEYHNNFPITVGSVPADFAAEVALTVATTFDIDASNVRALGLRDVPGGYGVVVDTEITYAGKDDPIEFGELTPQAAAGLNHLQQNTSAIFSGYGDGYFLEYLPVEIVDIVTEVYRMNTTVIYPNPSSSAKWTTTQTQANDCVEALALKAASLFDDEGSSNGSSSISELSSVSIDGITHGNGKIPLDPPSLASSGEPPSAYQIPGPQSSEARDKQWLHIVFGGLVAVVFGIGGICLLYIVHAKRFQKLGGGAETTSKPCIKGEGCSLGEILDISNNWELSNNSSRYVKGRSQPATRMKTAEQDNYRVRFIDYTQVLSMDDCEKQYHKNAAIRSLDQLQNVCNRILNMNPGTDRMHTYDTVTDTKDSFSFEDNNKDLTGTAQLGLNRSPQEGDTLANSSAKICSLKSPSEGIIDDSMSKKITLPSTPLTDYPQRERYAHHFHDQQDVSTHRDDYLQTDFKVSTDPAAALLSSSLLAGHSDIELVIGDDDRVVKRVQARAKNNAEITGTAMLANYFGDRALEDDQANDQVNPTAHNEAIIRRRQLILPRFEMMM